MGAKRILQLSELTNITPNDVIVIVHSGTTYQTTINELLQIFPINDEVVNLNFVDDAAAETGGIPIGGIYHTDGVLKIRLPDPGQR